MICRNDNLDTQPGIPVPAQDEHRSGLSPPHAARGLYRGAAALLCEPIR
jgi:hypothetical protein